MKLLTQEIRRKLLRNGRINHERLMESLEPLDHRPVVKLFNPVGAATWLLTELDPDDTDIAFGLCDLGFGTPELGSVRISELASVRLPYGLGIERDRYFEADKPLSAYANEARSKGKVVA